MGVKVTVGQTVYSLTSPPEQPTPYPPSELIAEAINYGDRTVLVTVPFPDTIELVANVLNEHLSNPDATGGNANKIAKKLDDDLKQHLEAWKTGETLADPKPRIKLGAKATAIFDFGYDPANPLYRARLTLWREPDKTHAGFGSWKLKLEFARARPVLRVS